MINNVRKILNGKNIDPPPIYQPKTVFDLESYMPFQINLLLNQIRRISIDSYVKNIGISAREWRVLMTIGCLGPQMPAQIAACVKLDRATVTRGISNLIKLGLVKTTLDPLDGRRKMVYLTEKGACKCDEILPLMLERDQQLSQGLTSDEMCEFKRLINKVKNYAAQIEESL